MPSRQRRCAQSDNDDTNLADPPSMLPEAAVDELVERLIWQTTGAVGSNRREALMTWAGLRGPKPPTMRSPPRIT